MEVVMSKKVSISKKIAAGLMVGLMLGSCVHAQAGWFSRVTSWGNTLVKKVSTTVFGTQESDNQSRDVISSSIDQGIHNIIYGKPSFEEQALKGIVTGGVKIVKNVISIIPGINLLKSAIDYRMDQFTSMCRNKVVDMKDSMINGIKNVDTMKVASTFYHQNPTLIAFLAPIVASFLYINKNSNKANTTNNNTETEIVLYNRKSPVAPDPLLRYLPENNSKLACIE